MTRIQNGILLKHKFKKVIGCFLENINFDNSNSLSLFYLTVLNHYIFEEKKQKYNM
jgi:hypothetical protein